MITSVLQGLSRHGLDGVDLVDLGVQDVLLAADHSIHDVRGNVVAGALDPEGLAGNLVARVDLNASNHSVVSSSRVHSEGDELLQLVGDSLRKGVGRKYRKKRREVNQV